VALLPKLILAIVVFTLLFFIANQTRNFVNKRLSTQMDDPLLARFLARLTKMAINIIGLLFVLKIIGLSDIAAGLITGASVSAIVVGFAFKDIGENFLAGIMLAFNRPFRVGDTVELNGHTGKVIALNLRNTQIKSFDGKDIFIPNANIVKNPVINYTIDGFLRYDFTVGLDYGSDVDKAMKIMMDTLMKVPNLLKDKGKGPSVSYSSLGASSLNLTAYFWIDTEDPKVSAGTVRTEAVDKVLSALDEAGFYMPGDIVEMKNYKEVELKTAKRELKEEAV
jgi:small-conductance mechanosensitive channel